MSATSTNGSDGGMAFPPNAGWRDDDPACRGMSLRDYFAIRAPAPAKEEIEFVLRMEQQANPHNDHYKPARRSAVEIECSLRFKWADAMLKARGK